MTYKGYVIKPVDGKRIGKGAVKLFRRSLLKNQQCCIDTYNNVTDCKQSIDLFLTKNKGSNYASLH